MADSIIPDNTVVKKIVRVRYICTVPRGGIQAIKCYPDAEIFLIKGRKLGYSKKEKTLIIPRKIPGSETHMLLEEFLHAKQK